MAVVGTLREFLCQQGLFQGSQFARQGLAQQGPSGGKFFAGPGFFCATSMSNSGVRSSANQKRICAGLGCARFSKKLASMSRRIIGPNRAARANHIFRRPEFGGWSAAAIIWQTRPVSAFWTLPASAGLKDTGNGNERRDPAGGTSIGKAARRSARPAVRPVPGAKPHEIRRLGQNGEIGGAAKLGCAVKHARLSAHEQGTDAMRAHRRKDFAYRVRDQASLQG